MNIGNLGRKIVNRARCELEEINCRNISSMYDIAGYKRIYLVHIRKTGGTSLNNMFLSLAGADSQSTYRRLADAPSHRILQNGKIYVGWNVRLINRGNYFYAFSHTPFHQLKLPDKTFVITCFRDPVKRVISHYNMLMDFSIHGIQHPAMAEEGLWLGNSFDDFIERIPREHLLNQIFMFSNTYNIDEAVLNVSKLSHWMFTENFNDEIGILGKKTGLPLRPIHVRKANYHAPISDASIAWLRERVELEYLFLDQLKKLTTVEDKK